MWHHTPQCRIKKSHFFYLKDHLYVFSLFFVRKVFCEQHEGSFLVRQPLSKTVGFAPGVELIDQLQSRWVTNIQVMTEKLG